MSFSIKNLKIILTILLILTLFFSFATFVNADSDSVYKYSTYSKKNDVVYFQKPADWVGETPYIYAWDSYDASPSNRLGDSFPGIEMTLVDGNLYKYEFDSDVSYKKLIFSNGTNSKQTQDLDYICNGYIYNFDNKENLGYVPKYLKSGDTVKFEKPDSWDDTIYIYMWNSGNGNKNSDWHTRTMTVETGNLYSYTLSNEDWNVTDGFDMVIFSDSSHKKTKDLSTVDSDIIFKGNDTPIDSGNDRIYDGIWLYTDDHISILQQIVNQYSVSSEDVPYYTEDSYAIYTEQRNLANEVISNSPNVATSFYDLTSQYEKSKLAVPFAYNNLKLSTQLLSDKINEMKNVDVSKYAPELVDAFDQSIEDAEGVLNDLDNITIPKMKDAIQKMVDAFNNLKVDKTELESLINEAKNIDTTIYTNDSVDNLLTAINNAVTVLEDNDAGYLDVKDQIEKLNTAISNLVKIEDANNNNSTSKDSDENNSSESDSQKNSIFNNPHTGDMILVTVGIFAVSILGIVLTKKHIKKNK